MIFLSSRIFSYGNNVGKGAEVPLFIWKPSYLLDIPEIDNDHRHLVGLVNELYEAMKTGHGYEQVNALLDQLLAYADEHFANEEGFMRACNYPQIQAHILEHQEFRDKVGEMDRERRAGESLPSTELMDFLCSWLRTHVFDSDKEFGTYMKRHGRDRSFAH